MVTTARKWPRRGVNQCRACHRPHTRESVVCGEAACAKWLRERDEELSLRAEAVLRGRDVIADRRLT